MSWSSTKIGATVAAALLAAGVAGGVRYAVGHGEGSADAVPTAATMSTSSEDTVPNADERPTASGTQMPGSADDAIIADCNVKADELERRDEADLIDWEALDTELLDPESSDEDSIELTLSPIDGRVAAPGDRFEPDRFGAELDLGAVSDVDLREAVEICFTAGVLGEDEEEEADEAAD